MKLNLRQAIKMVAQLREDLNKEQEKISNQFTTPLVVNGESIINNDKLNEVCDSYEQIGKLAGDIITLRNAISNANSENGLTLDSIALQELRKLNRNIESQLENSRYLCSNDVVSGVGVVEKGVIGEEPLLKFVKDNKTQMVNIQNAMDEANNDIEIEVVLETM